MKVSEFVAKIGDRELVRQILSYVYDMTLSDVFLLEKIEQDVADKVLCVAEQVQNGIPLAYVVGKTWFYDLPFVVDESVLIPRNDTEVLVESVLKLVYVNHSGFIGVGGCDELSGRILDMCTGSGCVAIAISKNLGKDVKVTAVDISGQALEVAKRNAVLNNVEIEFIQSDLFKKLQGNKYDIIVSNPPYIRTCEIGIEDVAILREPRIALDGGADGLDFYRRLVTEAKDFLVKGGILAVEIGFDQGDDVRKLFEVSGFDQIRVTRDLSGHDRVVLGLYSCKEIIGNM